MNTSTDELKKQITELIKRIKNKSYKLDNENGVFSFIKAYLNSIDTKIQMADSYFYLGEYEKSLSVIQN